MKSKGTDRKTFSFHSTYSPCDFVAKLEKEAVNSNLKIEQNDADFKLQLDSNHRGRIVYKATVTVDARGGSCISGEITTAPWSEKPNEKKGIIDKILSIISYIVVIPFVLIFLLGYGIYMLFVRLFRGKSIEVTTEEKLCDFMVNKMYCRQMPFV